MNRVFAETFYSVALIHRKDASNRAVLEFSRMADRMFITTDEVLTEVLAFCASNDGLRKGATTAVRRIL